MQPGWGYKPADTDRMVFALEVQVPMERSCGIQRDLCVDTEMDRGYLELHNYDNPPGYCRVKVVGSAESVFSRVKMALLDNSDELTTDRTAVTTFKDFFVADEEGHLWLSSLGIMQNCTAKRLGNISGPAYKISLHNAEYEFDLVFALGCSRPLPFIQDFCKRQRPGRWPYQHTMKSMCNRIGVLVCVGHKGSPPVLQRTQFRFSFSIQEVLLAKDMPPWVKQGFIAFKYTVTAELKKVKQSAVSEGRSYISSYHMKTVLLWMLERNNHLWHAQCPFHIFLLLIRTFKSHLLSTPPNIPNYFIPECNLLENTDETEIESALHALHQIETDSVSTILGSPQFPEIVFSFTCTDVVPVIHFRPTREGENFTDGQNSTLFRVDMRKRCAEVTAAFHAFVSSSEKSQRRHFMHLCSILGVIDNIRERRMDEQRQLEAHHERPECQNLKDLLMMLCNK